MTTIDDIPTDRDRSVVMRDDSDVVDEATVHHQDTEAAPVSTAAADFARLLFKLLENPTHQDIVCWGSSKDYFVIKNSNEFERVILPCILNHSSLTSFARRLNKYGFDKLKRAEVDPDMDHTWAFHHTNFHRDRPEDLQNIKRKVSAPGTSTNTSSGSLPGSSDSNAASSSSLPRVSPSSNQDRLSIKSNSNSNSNSYPVSSNSNRSNVSEPSRAEMKADIERLNDDGKELQKRADSMERNHEAMLKSIQGIEKRVELRGRHINDLMQYLISNTNEPPPSSESSIAVPLASTDDSESISTFTGHVDTPSLSTHQQIQSTVQTGQLQLQPHLLLQNRGRQDEESSRLGQREEQSLETAEDLTTNHNATSWVATDLATSQIFLQPGSSSEFNMVAQPVPEPEDLMSSDEDGEGKLSIPLER